MIHHLTQICFDFADVNDVGNIDSNEIVITELMIIELSCSCCDHDHPEV